MSKKVERVVLSSRFVVHKFEEKLIKEKPISAAILFKDVNGKFFEKVLPRAQPGSSA